MYSLLKYLSFRKIYNLILVYCGYLLSVITKRVFVLANPFSLSVEPTNSCNLRCLECPTGNKTSNRLYGQINFDLYKSIINGIKNDTLYLMLYFQGEPFLHPGIFEMIQYADKNSIYTMTSTNGHYLSIENTTNIVKSGLKEILISVDGISQGVYEKYREGGNLEAVKSGIQNLIESKSNLNSKYPIIRIQFLVMKHNEREIPELYKEFLKSGVDRIELKSVQVEDFIHNSGLIPNAKKYSRYTHINDIYKIKSKFPNRCFRLWSTMVVTWDGTIVPCCFDKNQEFPLANIENGTFQKYWKNKHFTSFRNQIITKRKKIKMCTNCHSGLTLKN